MGKAQLIRRLPKMANISSRKDKDGNIISYRIRVYHGYDSKGKRLKPYS